MERAAAHLSGVRAPAVLDLCAGCGAVGVALARELPGARVIMADLSKPALRLCRENAERNGVGGRVRALASDLLAAFSERAAFDAILSNPPYVCTGEIGGLMPEVARYEPRAALDGGPDGMRFLREIALGAAPLLRSGGVLLLEMDSGQIPGIARAVRGDGRFLGAHRPGGSGRACAGARGGEGVRRGSVPHPGGEAAARGGGGRGGEERHAPHRRGRPPGGGTLPAGGASPPCGTRPPYASSCPASA